jgi:iron complex transport system substrate-binding protein
MKNVKIFIIIITFLLILCVSEVTASASTIMSVVDDSPDAITVLDSMGREVSIHKPVGSIAVIDALPQVASTLQAIGALDKVVAIDETTALEKVPSPDNTNITNIGNSEEPDLEKIVSLRPDLVIMGMYASDEKFKKFEDAGLTVLITTLFPTIAEGFDPTEQNTLVLGEITGTEDKAREFVNWREQYLDMIEERTSNLSESEKPSAMYAYKWDKNKIYGSGSTNRFHYLLDFIGTTDVNADVTGDWAEVELEHLIASNPSNIIFEEMSHNSGYKIPDTSVMMENIDTLKNLPGMSSVEAITKDQIYGIPVSILTGDTWLAAIYLAPVVHPELFSDLNPEKVHQEYVDKFLGIDFDVASDGLFLFPESSWTE